MITPLVILRGTKFERKEFAKKLLSDIMCYFSVDTNNSWIQRRICKFITTKNNSYKHNSKEIRWWSSKFFMAYVPP